MSLRKLVFSIAGVSFLLTALVIYIDTDWTQADMIKISLGGGILLFMSLIITAIAWKVPPDASGDSGGDGDGGDIDINI